MGFSVALHVNRTKLNIGVRKEADVDGQQTAEVVLNDNHHSAQATLDQATQHEFPILKILTAGSSNAAEHAFPAVTTNTDDQINACRSQLVAIAKFNVLAVHE